METSFKSLIEKSQSVLVLLPVRPTFDQVAAGLCVYMTIKDKKETSIACPTQMTVEFNRLIDVNRVSQELGSKNLEIRLVNYDAKAAIDKVSYDIENGNSYLRVIPKPGFPAPTKEQIEVTYSGVSADTVVLIGGANESHFPALVKGTLKGASLVHIGVKEIGLREENKPLSFARPGSSICEVVADLVVDQSPGSNEVVDPDVATNLIMGIEKATNSFASKYVTADTFQIVADLLKAGGKRLTKETKKSFIQPRMTQVGPGLKPQTGWPDPKTYKGTSIS